MSQRQRYMAVIDVESVFHMTNSLCPAATMPQAIKMFSKSLTDTDIKKRLAIPGKILSSLADFNGSNTVTIRLMYGTRMWPIVCSVRRTGYKKPVFSGGWRNFVICNDFRVGDKLTMYKVQDEAGSFHYRVEVEKLATPSVALSARALSLNHEVDETTGISRTKISYLEHEQEQLPKADARVKLEGAIMELADASVPFVDHAVAIPSGRIFGTGVSDEAKPHFKPEHGTEKKLGIGITMGEPSLHACYVTKVERDIEAPFDLNGGGSLATYATSQAAVEAYPKSTGRLSLDLVMRQPSPYDGAVNLELTLAPPIA
ncbi:Uncharacterized protein TCM_006206 [Theobroma cacao]|uniref:TF-B3 domain-containing protein n=1 Tax=Theobroma cacao TaxID=3641 RepID=A0A061DYF0_THECC|nr:Uncharacterized protein TCM_006206 [Theobroma cacao]